MNVLGCVPMDGGGMENFDVWAGLRKEGFTQTWVGKYGFIKGPTQVR